MQTEPYTFTVTSDCESYVGFNMYLATLDTNTLSDSSIHYVITEHDSKEVLVEEILSDAPNALDEFSADDQNQLNVGLGGTFGTIYKIYSEDIPLQGSVTYDLYLWVDESVTNDTMNQTFKAGIAIKSYDREAGPTLADYIIDNVYVEDGINGLYYHDEQGTYTNADQEAGDNSYRYAGNYFLTQKTKDEGYSVVSDLFYPIVILGGETYKELSLDVVIPLITLVCIDVNPADNFCVILLEENVDINNEESLREFLNSNSNYRERLIEIVADNFHDEMLMIGGEAGYETVFNQGQILVFDDMIQYLIDNQYIFYGVNNYICFGSDEEICPEESMYRIIGIFDNQVKIIKNTNATSDMLGTDGDYYSDDMYYWNYKYYWDYYEYGYGSAWKFSALNTENLNLNYLNYLGEKWSNLISVHKWTATGGGYWKSFIDVPLKETYTSEMLSNDKYDDYWYPESKIGLMYLNDYGYAAGPGNWRNHIMWYASVAYDNWLYSENNEWFITPETSYISVGYYTYFGNVTDGDLAGGIATTSSYFYVRPTFYLKSDVRYVSGTGTESDPYRIQ